VTMEQRGPEEQVTCYEASTGKHRWTAAWKTRFCIMGIGPRSTPTIAGGRVFALGAWGHLACVDGATGNILWERELLSDLSLDWRDEHRVVRFGRANSPLVTGGLVVVPGGGKGEHRASLLAYETGTGALRWRGGERQISYSSPTLVELAGRAQILIVNENAISGHAPDTGTELWFHKWPGRSNSDANVAQPVPVGASRLLLSKGYRHGAEVIELLPETDTDAIRVRTIWRKSSVLQTKFTTVVIWQGHAYGLSEGVLECVDVATGERRWREGRYGHGQILRVRDLLLILGDTGKLTLLRLSPDTPNVVLGQIQALSGRTWNNPALYGNLLLMRNATEAVCYELRTLVTDSPGNQTAPSDVERN